MTETTVGRSELAAMLVPGTVLGNKYELLGRIGHGGMGVIWKAKDRVADRLVALKFVPAELRLVESEMNRVRETFRKVHALQHQSICPLYSLEDGGHLGYYLVMKYLEGETLARYAARTDPEHKGLPIDRIIPILLRAAWALDYAHRNGVIHRDINPSNIFLVKVDHGAEVQVIDFGLADTIRASLSRVNQTPIDSSGARPYMAPEQWRGRRQTAATDQYALAVTAYELLAGHLPFEGTDLDILGNAVLNHTPEPIPTLSNSANAVLLKALAKQGTARFSSCEEFITTLSKFGQSVVETQAETTLSRPGVRTAAWNQQIISKTLLLFVLAAVIFIGLFWTGLFWGVGKILKPPADPPVVKNEPEQPVPLPPSPPVNNSLNVTDNVKQERKAGERMVLKIKDVEYAFRLCPAGTFMMGSPASEPWRDADETSHQVKISHDFWMLETEVTQSMWEGVMGNNPSFFKGSKLPVECVTWTACQGYVQKLNALGVTPKGYRFSLPTEAQWEYACRAGTTTAYHFGSTLTDKQANFGSSVGQTSAVGSYPANAWGLHDMHGNVWEWCLDWYGNYPRGSVIDPTGAVEGSDRVLRGGFWSGTARYCRSAYRGIIVPSCRDNNLGLRVSLVSSD